jgi:hypothetical protein
MKIAFTSCMDAERVPVQPIWQKIEQDAPDLLMLLGDNIYMDWGVTLGGEPKWKQIFLNDPEGPKRFAEEMYRRYALQWSVKEFRNFITTFVNKHGPEHLLVTWDDHDFAWNNSYGEGQSKSSVPIEVKTISKALFEQFASVLRAPANNLNYPPLQPNILKLKPATAGVEMSSPMNIGSLRFVLLDERFYRTDRQEPAVKATVLGEVQKKSLFDALFIKPQALTIIAGGSPLKHKYLLGWQSWDGNPNNLDKTPSYSDYLTFVQYSKEAKKPILYLAGDIHENEWGGQLDDSSIMHASSSGAAIGRFLLKRYDPSFGLVTIDENSCEADVQLKRLKRDGKLLIEFEKKLSYGTDGWISNGGDNAVAVIEDSLIDQHLSIFCARKRSAEYCKFDAVNNIPSSLIDQVYQDEIQVHSNHFPDIVELAPLESDHHLTGFSLRRSKVDDEINEMLQRVFQRAIAEKKQAVVFFVHGFNKTFSRAADEALTMHELYDVEPILFSWAAGEVKNKLSAPGEIHSAIQNIELTLDKLQFLLENFTSMAAKFPGIKRVVVARSLGAHMMSDLMSNIEPLSIDRIVFSAPGVESSCHERWKNGWAEKVMVTINQNDSTLSLLDLITVGAHILGRLLPSTISKKMTYFDCTDSPGVDRNHDYIFHVPNPDILSLHRLLLTGQPLPAAFLGFKQETNNVFIAH